MSESAGKIIKLLEELEKEQQDLDGKLTRIKYRRERLLEELAESLDANHYDLNDNNRSITWTGGKVFFPGRKNRQYSFIKILMKNRGEWVTFAELSPELTPAGVSTTLYSLDETLRLHSFPKEVKISKGRARIA